MKERSNAAPSAGARIGGIVIGMLIGAVIGGIAALLFAPQTGNETRELIRNRYGQMKEVFRGIPGDDAKTAKETEEG